MPTLCPLYTHSIPTVYPRYTHPMPTLYPPYTHAIGVSEVRKRQVQGTKNAIQGNSPIPICYLLLDTEYLILTTHHSPLDNYYLTLNIQYFPLTIHHLLPTS